MMYGLSTSGGMMKKDIVLTIDVAFVGPWSLRHIPRDIIAGRKMSSGNTGRRIIDTLKSAGIMSAIVKPADVDIDGEYEYSLNIDDSKNGCPLWQLEYVGTGLNAY